MSGHVTSNTSLDESRDYGSDLEDEIIVDDGGDDLHREAADAYRSVVDHLHVPAMPMRSPPRSPPRSPRRSPSPAAALVTSSSRDHLSDGYGGATCHRRDQDRELDARGAARDSCVSGGPERRTDNLSHNGKLRTTIDICDVLDVHRRQKLLNSHSFPKFSNLVYCWTYADRGN